MENTYTWDIIRMQTYPMRDGKANIVAVIYWVLTGTDGAYAAERRGAAGIEYVPSSEFKPYESLTKDEMIAWAQTSLGTEGVQEITDGIDSDLAQFASQPVFTNVPWSA